MTSSPSFNKEDLTTYLDRTCLENRAKWRALSTDPIFKYRKDQTLPQLRELAFQRMKKVFSSKVVSVHDFRNNPLNIFTAHEMIAMIDASLATKFTVQMNLFGGSMICLGSDRHSYVLSGIDDLSVVGCFALTELGFGNNAVEMQTTAHYDEKTKEFIIHSPTTLSQKYWITNGALHANHAVVFAQLYMPVKGTNEYKKEGIHTFLVKLRNQDGSLREGVFIEDMGEKLGANGVDNAKIAFNKVRTPRESILNRYSDVDENGVFTSKIPKMRDRFLRVADRLLSGRLCIAGLCMSGTKTVACTGLRYAKDRLVLGPEGKSTSPILEFQLFQEAVYPLLAKTICLHIAFNQIKELYSKDIFTTNMEIVRYVCFIKPLISWNLRELSSVLVERMGGQGYLAINRVCEGIGLGHSGITAEGDNSVLMQKVTKELMADLQSQKTSLPELTQCPKREIPQMEDVTKVETVLNLLKWREICKVKELGELTMKGMQSGKTIYDIWTRENNDLVQTLALAYSERKVFELAMKDIQANAKSSIQKPLVACLALYGTYLLNKDIGWFLISGSISTTAAKNLTIRHKQLVKEFHAYALDIVNGFGIPENLLTAPVAQDYVEFNNLPWTAGTTKPKL